VAELGIQRAIVLYGVTGVGKSIIADHLHAQLTNSQIVPTDMLRKVVALCTQDKTLSASSYSLTGKQVHSRDDQIALLDAFAKQNSAVEQAIKAAFVWSRATNRVLIVEGVNALACVSEGGDSQNAPGIFFVTISNPQVHMNMLSRRHALHPSPPVSMETYRKYFDNIRFMDDFLGKQAKELGHVTLDSSVLGVDGAVNLILGSAGLSGDHK
jgi:2-phosphoglycerate kinase